jgi:phosphohistidine phosphatase SixA
MDRVHLVLMRHATAESLSDSGRDEDRNLTERGVREARRVSSATQAAGFPQADLILTSGFARTQQTRAEFRWLNGHEAECSHFQPGGDVELARKALVEASEGGKGSIWLFSHNPLLTQALATWCPEILLAVRKVRKADCFWIRWESPEFFLRRNGLLCGYIRKPMAGSVQQTERSLRS